MSKQSEYPRYPLSHVDGDYCKWAYDSAQQVAVDRDGNVYKRKIDIITGEHYLAQMLLKPNKLGYVVASCIYRASRNQKVTCYVHILVAETFISKRPFPSAQVSHIDGCKSNNCVNNLRWASPQDNCQTYHKNAKANGIKKTRKKAKRTYEVIMCDLEGNELMKFPSIKSAGQYLADILHKPNKSNSISTMISYNINHKYGCLTVHGYKFKVADPEVKRYINHLNEKKLTKDEEDIVEKMRAAAKKIALERKMEKTKKCNTKLPKEATIHHYCPKTGISYSENVETDYSGRVDLGSL